jgi:hypothetical protein
MRKINKKGQALIDLIITFSALMLVFLILFNFMIKDRLGERVEQELRLDARIEAEKVWFAVATVTFAGTGTNKTIFLSDTLSRGVEYNITVYQSGSINVDYSNRLYTIALPTKNVNQTVLPTGKIHVKNENGVILFE